MQVKTVIKLFNRSRSTGFILLPNHLCWPRLGPVGRHCDRLQRPLPDDLNRIKPDSQRDGPELAPVSGDLLRLDSGRTNLEPVEQRSRRSRCGRSGKASEFCHLLLCHRMVTFLSNFYSFFIWLEVYISEPNTEIQ